ncbi:MAG: ribosome maturation factor RimM [Oceanospirillaceae bacterium]|nr:ribosome maturation factor RimM [Oceanospirillaceae bacterium]|tara:strand:+ start:314 stop:856 length:543 start_codon:yes stop_codon:yes gene_type:complete
MVQQVSDQELDVTVLGKVTTAFGIKGWVKVYSFTDPMVNILEYPSWLLKCDGRWRTFKVLDGQQQGKGLVARLQGVSDRDAALALSQVEIGIPTAELPEPDEDEHYWFQLIGLKVKNTEGELLGQVKELFESGGGNQVMTLTGCEGSIDQQKRMIPYVGAIVLEVDLDKGELLVDWQADF